jgi:predicted GNAT family acetyltransferase
MQSFRKFLNKKIVSVSIIFLIVLFGGLFFWWQDNKEIKGSPDDYVIKETEEGIFVENKKAGLIVKAPEGWETKKIEKKEGSIVIQTSNVEGERVDEVMVPPLVEGCGIETAVTYKALSLEEIKKEVEKIHWALAPIYEEFEEIVINDRKALKNMWESKTRGSMVSVYISNDSKVYSFTLIWAFDEKDICIQEFDEFLETVSIL